MSQRVFPFRSPVRLLLTASLLAGSLLLAAGSARARPAPAPSLVGLLNLNEASEAQLQLLPGVGPARARAITAYRARVRFGTIGQLRRLRGFGPRIFLRLRPYLRVEGPTTLARAEDVRRESSVLLASATTAAPAPLAGSLPPTSAPAPLGMAPAPAAPPTYLSPRVLPTPGTTPIVSPAVLGDRGRGGAPAGPADPAGPSSAAGAERSGPASASALLPEWGLPRALGVVLRLPFPMP